MPKLPGTYAVCTTGQCWAWHNNLRWTHCKCEICWPSNEIEYAANWGVKKFKTPDGITIGPKEAIKQSQEEAQGAKSNLRTPSRSVVYVDAKPTRAPWAKAPGTQPIMEDQDGPSDGQVEVAIATLKAASSAGKVRGADLSALRMVEPPKVEPELDPIKQASKAESQLDSAQAKYDRIIEELAEGVGTVQELTEELDEAKEYVSELESKKANAEAVLEETQKNYIALSGKGKAAPQAPGGPPKRSLPSDIDDKMREWISDLDGTLADAEATNPAEVLKKIQGMLKDVKHLASLNKDDTSPIDEDERSHSRRRRLPPKSQAQEATEDDDKEKQDVDVVGDSDDSDMDLYVTTETTDTDRNRTPPPEDTGSVSKNDAIGATDEDPIVNTDSGKEDEGKSRARSRSAQRKVREARKAKA